MVSKGLAVSVILLFIGVAVQPSVATVQQESISNEYLNEHSPLEIIITKPENGIYVFNHKILPFFIPLVLCGSIYIDYKVLNGSGLVWIDFYLNGILQETFFYYPHYGISLSWHPFSKITVKLIAYTFNETASDEITIWRIFR